MYRATKYIVCAILVDERVYIPHNSNIMKFICSSVCNCIYPPMIECDFVAHTTALTLALPDTTIRHMSVVPS